MAHSTSPGTKILMTIPTLFSKVLQAMISMEVLVKEIQLEEEELEVQVASNQKFKMNGKRRI